MSFAPTLKGGLHYVHGIVRLPQTSIGPCPNFQGFAVVNFAAVGIQHVVRQSLSKTLEFLGVAEQVFCTDIIFLRNACSCKYVDLLIREPKHSMRTKGIERACGSAYLF